MGRMNFLVTEYEMLEASFVSVPADFTCGWDTAMEPETININGLTVSKGFCGRRCYNLGLVEKCVTRAVSSTIHPERRTVTLSMSEAVNFILSGRATPSEVKKIRDHFGT